jgi:predicted unusual protein kinase regulating ubiquinone biosynthesis (AarF/ABC1/UbiB family)
MGATYVKLGQLLSSRSDIFPEVLLHALARLQDNVKPFAYADVETILESELNCRLSKAFQEITPQPLAAASLGQVHRAILRDGRPVVVKVQRPGIREQVIQDLEALTEVAQFLDGHTRFGRNYRIARIVDELKTTFLQELDYQREATNLVKLAGNLQQFPHIRVPQPVNDYTTARVLTMDYVRGSKITSLSPLAHLDMNGHQLADELFRAYLQQVLVDGTFHADPHPGNVFLTDDSCIALLDLGMIGHTTPQMQEQLLKLLMAMSERNSEDALEIVLGMSETREDFDEPEFRRKIGHIIMQQGDTSLDKFEVGKGLLAVTRISAHTGLYVPTELTMIGKTLLQLDEVGKVLAPEFNPNEALRRELSSLLSRRMWKSLAPGSLIAPLLEMKTFLTGLPGRLTKILDALGNAELEMSVKTPDAERLLVGFQKIANRITTGLILAALIVGASLLMQVQSPFRIFGYPGLAIVSFLLAAGGGLWLIGSILLQDFKDRKQRRR